MIRYAKFILLCFFWAFPTLLMASENRSARHERQLGTPNLTTRALQAASWQSLQTAAVSPDAKISETVSPAMFSQDNPSLAVMKNRRLVAAWQDQRLGAQKIFLQEFDSTGVSVGPNRLVASSQSGADYVEPKLAVDTTGRVYLFWRDRSNGLIFGSRYNSDLTASLAPFIVNDTASGALAGLYDFAIYPDGRLVVVWENYTIAGNTVQMRLYTSSGSSLAGPSQVNSDVATTSHWSPTVAVQPGSGFLITWEDYRSGNADVMCRLFTGAGSPVAPEFTIVPPGPADSAQYEPQAVYSQVDYYIIGWIDSRDGQEIYLQQYNPVTGLAGANVLASTGDTSIENWDPELAISPAGKLLVTWGSYGSQQSIVARRFGAGLTALGAPMVQNMSTIGQRWAPSTEYFSAAQYGIAWTESQNNDEDIAFMLLDTLGTRQLAQEKILNDDAAGAPSLDPDIAAVSSWYDLIAFTDQRRDHGDIYVQAVSRALVKTYSNRRMNTDAGFDLQNEPSIAPGRDSNLVLWVDSRALQGTSGQRIFGRLVNDLGVPAGPEIVISDSAEGSPKAAPHAAISTNGRILTAWIDNAVASTPVIKARWLTAGGQPDGAVFSVSTPAAGKQVYDLSAGHDSAGRLYLIWRESTISSGEAVVTWYNADKSSGGTFRYGPTQTGQNIDKLATAVSDSGTIALFWLQAGPIPFELNVTTLNRTGTVLLAPIRINPDTTSVPLELDVSIDEHNYVSTVWTDARTGVRRLYYQVLVNTGALLGANQQVSSTVADYMAMPSAAGALGHLFVAWVDPRQDGDNVWAKVLVYLPTDVDDGNTAVPSSFALFQNYPNPFNPTTEIRFTLPKRADISLTVYNVLGQRVVLLATGSLAAGEHRIMWNGRDSRGDAVATGLYFYRLSSDDFSQTRKMLLLK